MQREGVIQNNSLRNQKTNDPGESQTNQLVKLVSIPQHHPKKAQRYRVQKEQNNIQRYKHDGQIYSLVRFKPLLCYTQAKNIVVKCFLLSINDPAQSTFTCKMNGDRYFIHETFVLITLLKNYVYFIKILILDFNINQI